MNQKSVNTGINTDQFETLNAEIAVEINGGTDTDNRNTDSIIFQVVYKVIDFFSGK